MTSKGSHEDIVEILLILGIGLAAFIVVRQIPLHNIINTIITLRSEIITLRSAIQIAVVLPIGITISVSVVIGSVWRKKMLIDAFAQQVSDEISRMDIDTPIAVTEKMLQTSARFTVDGLPNITKELRAVFEGSGKSEAEVLAGVAHEVVEFNQQKFSSFLFARTTLRWTVDGLEALIGDHQSIEVAWAKGIRYLNRFLPEKDRYDLPWIPTYMKLLGLPHNFRAKNFQKQAEKAMARQYPKGYFSLLMASKLPGYRDRLRLFHLAGEEAWREMLRFKADTINYELFKRTFPPQRGI
jgi:hypothetical protein